MIAVTPYFSRRSYLTCRVSGTASSTCDTTNVRIIVVSEESTATFPKASEVFILVSAAVAMQSDEGPPPYTWPESRPQPQPRAGIGPRAAAQHWPERRGVRRRHQGVAPCAPGRLAP